MIKEISKKLLSELELGLEELTAEVDNPLERLVQNLKLIRHYLDELKQMTLQSPFEHELEEIHLFKYIKPAFYCYHIYCREMYTIETALPFGNIERQVVFLEDELAYVERYFKKYAFLYQYYKLDANELDGTFFVRGKEVQTILLPNVPELDPSFSTSCDYLFSKFRAFEMLKTWLQEKISDLRGDPLADSNAIPTHGLRWTGDSINLVEIAYGWYFTGEINNGNAGIGEIVKMLEKVFKITIGKPSRRFAEIRQRKRLSNTQYIDQMKASIAKKLYDDDEFNATLKS